MRAKWLLIGLLAFVPVAFVAASEKGDKAKLQGVWEVVSLEVGGQAVGEDQAKAMRIEFKDDELIVQRPDGERLELPYTIDPSKNPKHITVEINGEKGLGIYELKGDTLKLAHGEVGDPRPKNFDDPNIANLTVVTFKRRKN